MKNELVLLHGWGFQSTVWHHFIPYLKPHFNITALDLLGFGNNPEMSKSINLDLLTKDVLKNAPHSAIFLGWSLGGLVAMNIAIHHPQRITHLITLASTPKFIADEHWPGMPSQLLEQFSHALQMDYYTTLQQFILLQFQGSHVDRHIVKSLQQQIAENPAPSAKALNDGLTILKDTDLRNQLADIQCPQLYLFGRCDTLVPAAVADKTKALTQHADTVVLPKVSHAPFLSNPQLCSQKIAAFLL